MGLTDYDAEIAQHAAHLAVLTPNAITPMLDYQSGGNLELTNPILINFGYDTSSPEWNALTGYTVNSSIGNLKDQEGNYTGISITIVEQFNNRNQLGPKSTSTNLNMTEGISSDSYYGNAGKIWDKKEIKQSIIKLTGLNKDRKYNLCFFGSRVNVTNENRETKYIVSGVNEVVTFLDTANNTSKIACADNVQADENGEIFITVTAGDNNNNEYGFYYINALNLIQAN